MKEKQLYELACNLAQFLDKMNPWEFRDVFDSIEESVKELEKQILSNPSGLVLFLADIFEGRYEREDKQTALELFESIETF
jgi:hypothetical protein